MSNLECGMTTHRRKTTRIEIVTSLHYSLNWIAHFHSAFRNPHSAIRSVHQLQFPPQDLLQVIEVEWLDYVIEGSQVQRPSSDRLVGHGGDHDDPDLLVVFLYFLQNFQAPLS